MKENWDVPEENMEDSHVDDFRVRKPQNEGADTTGLKRLLGMHTELTGPEVEKTDMDALED